MDGIVTAPDPPSDRTTPEAPSSATILVVEDEDALRRLVVRMLRRMGYSTLEADQHTHLLAKPYTMHELGAFVAGVLKRS